MSEQLPELVAAATAEQPGARAALAAALRRGPSHAYSFVGPTGSGKAAAARAFAAELLAVGSPGPRRGTAPGARRPLAAPRPGLAAPAGQPAPRRGRPPRRHRRRRLPALRGGPPRLRDRGRRRDGRGEPERAPEDARGAARLRPPDPDHRRAGRPARDGSQPLLADRVRAAPAGVPAAPSRRRVPRSLPEELAALAALAGGDLGRARLLGSPTGSRLRAHAEAAARAAIAGELAGRVWADLLALAAESGKLRADVVKEAARERADEFGKGRDATRARREGEEAAKRADRRARTDAIDLGLGLVAAWFADLAAIGEGASEAVRNVDRTEQLTADARRVAPIAARQAAELAMDTRRRLQVNVNEDLALDALFHRVAALIGDAGAVV